MLIHCSFYFISFHDLVLSRHTKTLRCSTHTSHSWTHRILLGAQLCGASSCSTSRVWISSVPSAAISSVYLPQTFSSDQQYLKEKKVKMYTSNHQYLINNILIPLFQQCILPGNKTHVLSVCSCAAKCRSSTAPSSSSSWSPSAETSDWLPHCGGGPWCPCFLSWPSPNPPHPLSVPLPPPPASFLSGERKSVIGPMLGVLRDCVPNHGTET